MKPIIGIDPGNLGGFAFWRPDVSLDMEPMPTMQEGKHVRIDEHRVRDILKDWDDGLVYIELVGAMPKQGVCSMFNFGVGWGLVRGICVGLGMPYMLVRPQAWQKVMLAGHPKGSEYAVASRLWPGADWHLSPRAHKPHEGLVDAALIAEYGRRAQGA